MVPGCSRRVGSRGITLYAGIIGANFGGCVKILLDSSTPADLARSMSLHQVVRTRQLGWQSLEDGSLLDVAERHGFQVLITCDQNLPYQQNFTDRKIAVLILSTNHWPTLRPLAARIANLVAFLQRGQVRRIDVRAL